MHRAIILAVSTLIFAAHPARAQSVAQESKTEAILAAARQQLAKGEACLAAGNVECARRERYDHDITLTGADHEEHRRLYGRGSAYDIRVRDLTREQVAFIIGKGNELGLRIKDFSTWERVAAHNARSAQLGRAPDTYATGVHLHIDRM